MKIIRYQDSRSEIHFASVQSDGSKLRIEGNPLGDWTQTQEPAQVAKLLSPIEPRDILCIGLNYRKHAAEGGQAIPEFPVLFMKNSGALTNPGDPIVLPNDMIFDVPTLIEFLSGSTRLAPGTVILTGTPHGVGGARKPPVYLKDGDTVTIEIEKIGALTNPVVDESIG